MDRTSTVVAGESGEHDPSPAPPAGHVRLWVVGLCLATLFLDGLDLQLLAFAAPLILKEWSVPVAAFGAALSASLAGMAFGSLLGG